MVFVKLEPENKQDRERVLSLMRTQSSAIRFIYNRLVASVLPLLGEFFVRDFSPLKPALWWDYAQGKYWVNNWTKPEDPPIMDF